MKKKLLSVVTLCLLLLVLGSLPVCAETANVSSRSDATQTLNVQKKTMYVGETCKLKIKGNKNVKWTSSNEKVATVSEKGIVKAKKAGKCVIKAVVNEVTFKFNLTVEKPYIVGDETIYVGQSYQFEIKGNKNAEWSSSNKKVATVSEKGIVKAKKAGKCVIKAVVNGMTLEFNLTVEKPYSVDENNNVKVEVQYYSPYFLKGILKDGRIYSSILIGPSTIRTKFAKDPWVDSYQAFLYFSGMKFGRLDVYDDAVWGSAEFAWELYNSNNRVVKRGVYSTGRQHYLVPVKGEIVVSHLKMDNYTFKLFSYRKTN